jgi:putative autoinducer-2 (AI-2) aldolase
MTNSFVISMRHLIRSAIRRLSIMSDTLDGREVAGCPVPIVIAGGKKLPERDALEMAYHAIDQGASGVDMGRNVFQSKAPVAMLQALAAIVHKRETGEKAYALFSELAQVTAA